MRWDRLTPAEIAGLDAALMEGIAGALERKSGLLLTKTGATGDGGWICAFPPCGLSFVAAKEWARRHCFAHSLDELYLTFNEVVCAGADIRAAASEKVAQAAVQPLQATIIPQKEFDPEQPAAPGVSRGRLVDSRGSRAWVRAFQNGFSKTSRPVESDADAFIELLEIANRRQS